MFLVIPGTRPQMLVVYVVSGFSRTVTEVYYLLLESSKMAASEVRT